MDLGSEPAVETLLDQVDQDLTDEEYEDLNEAEPQAQPVVYSGQDFDVEGLVRRLRNDDIKVPQFGHEDPDIDSAGFQRGFVWTRPQMDRFIESLLLGYPIPGVFFVRQADRRYLVLDGQQRLRTLQFFYRGVYDEKEFSLKNVAVEFRGLTYESLPGDLRRTLDNAFIQATIVDSDGSKESLDAVYQIFERLNSGGTQLTPHEIRVALYAGPFIDLLESLNKSEQWRHLYGKKSPRIRDQELILRIIALYCDSESYARPLKGFLNDFMVRHRSGRSKEIQDASELFLKAAEILALGPGDTALRKFSRQVNAAQAEAVFVGAMRRLSASDLSGEQAMTALTSLRSDKEFDTATGRATADEEPVATRLRLATEAFEHVK